MLKSKVFWTLVVDSVVSLLLYFLGKYASPSLFQDAQVVIAAIQAIVMALLGGPVVGKFFEQRGLK